MSLPKIMDNTSNGVAVLSKVIRGPGIPVSTGSEKDELLVVGVAVVDVFGHVSVSVCEWLVDLVIVDVVVGCVSVTVTAETSGVCMLAIISVSSSSTDMNILAIPKLSGTSCMFTDSSCGCH